MTRIEQGYSGEKESSLRPASARAAERKAKYEREQREKQKEKDKKKRDRERAALPKPKEKAGFVENLRAAVTGNKGAGD
jgi:hypothetical protein